MITITQSPPQTNPAVGPNVWVLDGLVGANRYVLAVEIGATIVNNAIVPGTLVATFKQTPNPSGVGIFSLGEVLQSYLGEYNLPDPIEELVLGATPGAALLYRIRFGFEIGDQVTFEDFSPFRVVFNGYKEQWDVAWPEGPEFLKDLVELEPPCDGIYALPSPNKFLRDLFNLNAGVQTATVSPDDWHTISWLNYGGQVFDQIPYGSGAEEISNFDKSPTHALYEFFSNADLTGPISTSVVELSAANGFPIRATPTTDEWNITDPLLVGTLGSGPQNLEEAGIWPGDATKSYRISLFSGECPAPGTAFIMTANLNFNVVSSDNFTFTIPTVGSGYDFTVDWGDDIVETYTGTPGNIDHVYAVRDIYDITITGDFPRISFFNQVVRNKLIRVKQWGNIQWSTFQNAFSGCTQLEITAIDAPILSGVTSMSFAFSGCTNANFGTAHNFNSWNTSTVLNMTSMFQGATNFNQPIGNWNTSSVLIMNSMFKDATAFNQPIGTWNTSSVNDMFAMFESATAFNQDIGTWNTGAVQNMGEMFDCQFAVGTSTFNQYIGDWNTSSVLNMTRMFRNASVFNQDISGWDTGLVTTMANMFQNAIVFNEDLSPWCVELIPSEPVNFSTNTPAWNKTNRIPLFGVPC